MFVRLNGLWYLWFQQDSSNSNIQLQINVITKLSNYAIANTKIVLEVTKIFFW